MKKKYELYEDEIIKKPKMEPGVKIWNLDELEPDPWAVPPKNLATEKLKVLRRLQELKEQERKEKELREKASNPSDGNEEEE